MNDQIRTREVRVVDENGEQLGILPTRDAYNLAMERGLDLVEVAPQERPPVCRIMDFGKFKYEQKKKQQESRKKQHTVQVKEIRLRPKTDTNDISIKSKRALNFLEEGHKVQISMNFRGREMAHREIAYDILQKMAEELSEVGKVERPPSMDGRRMIMILMRRPGLPPKAQREAKAREAAEREKAKAAERAKAEADADAEEPKPAAEPPEAVEPKEEAVEPKEAAANPSPPAEAAQEE